jgi:hypothetical protein
VIVSIHQPQYLPWLGYFDKIDKVDVFCFLDNVQFKKNEWQNRNRVKTVQGWQWMTVPVKHRFGQLIKEVEINNTVNWRRKHLQTLATNYRRAPFFKEYFGLFEEAYSREWELLSELNIYFIEILCALLKLGAKWVLASTLDLRDEPTDRLIDICKVTGANTYFSGRDGVQYMDLDRFDENEIKVVVQDFKHPDYPQLAGVFQPYMSIVDLLFNCGLDSMEKIRSCNLPSKHIA